MRRWVVVRGAPRGVGAGAGSRASIGASSPARPLQVGGLAWVLTSSVDNGISFKFYDPPNVVTRNPEGNDSKDSKGAIK